MKRIGLGMLALTVLLIFCQPAQGAKHIYKWVKDKRINSDRVLPSQQKIRTVPISESQSLELVRKVMAEDLFLALAEYHTTKHIQDAETTSDSVLPEEVVGQQEVELVDEDYRFFLEVKLRAYGGNRTRITAKVSPMYRIRDVAAEDEASGDSSAAETSVEVKVKAGEGSAVGLGPIYVVPIEGLPLDYHCQLLPDAAERASKIVRSFFYLLDKRIATSQGN